MSELDDFLTKTLARQVEAEEAIHNGDVTPRMEMWSLVGTTLYTGGQSWCKRMFSYPGPWQRVATG